MDHGLSRIYLNHRDSKVVQDSPLIHGTRANSAYHFYRGSGFKVPWASLEAVYEGYASFVEDKCVRSAVLLKNMYITFIFSIPIQ